ncbi:MAG TPA: hypothetical protein VEI01_26215 [Terriglobales bacterium]|nr:hypothetical protein [Terriglobales bacterium]
MRSYTILVLAVAGALALGVLATAENNKYGVADVTKITFTAPVRIGDAPLPAGDYEVRHTMEGENHIMVFRQLHVTNPAEAHVKCTLVPLSEKATRTATTYTVNASNEQVVQEIVFRGDTAKHVF